MNKKLRQVLCLTFGAMMLFSTVGCKDDEDPGAGVQKYDTENRPVVFSIGALDQNFNPFFSTSATDTEIISVTQLGMLTIDSEGNYICGENEATVALDYNITYKDAGGNVVSSGRTDGSTVYEFVIKNGIKFSDGDDLTIDDVLFNLYVYLDPAYNGSATIYSTKIKGLNAYRQQNPELQDDEEVDGTSSFALEAVERINMIKAYCDENDEDLAPYYPDTTEIPQVLTDLRLIKDFFYEELQSDWTALAGSVASDAYPDYSFTQDWEAFLLNCGVIYVKTELNANGKIVPIKQNGKYVTSLVDVDFADQLASYVATNWQAYQTANACTEQEAKNAVTKEWAINLVYESYCSGYNYRDGESASIEDDDNSRVAEILDAWATGSKVLERFTSEARSKYFQTAERVPSVSGITQSKTNTFKGKDLGAMHDVLRIEINGVDPKALANFSFGVAPRHYYSNESTWTQAEKDAYPYGVKTGNTEFFTTVLSSDAKNGLPVGAGVYKASNENGGSGTIDRTTFFRNNVVYFQRNTYFDTVGGDQVHNANIKYLNYKVVNEANIMSALETGDIDYGQPNAKQDNINKVASNAHLDYVKYLTGGYGYVGINPKFVPEVELRVAIMKAMNRNWILDYYGDMAELIERPVSKTSWAYPSAAKLYDTDLNFDMSFTTNTDDIIELVEMAGYTTIGEDGVRRNDDGDKLKFKFTIAGETTDHPAYSMFNAAADLLSSCGFDITVGTDVQALKKLATGGMAVWAAAWSSALDPDMYQVYHKDSTATSVKNWNYSQILDPANDKYSYERNIVLELSEVIEQGRKTDVKGDRIRIYDQALDMVMNLAVELPTYQRNDLIIFNKDVIDSTTLNKEVEWPNTVISKLWKLNFN
ncbi:MAG: hypothetical protein IJV80_05160 [Clostridia bacterium]|nr:hypothetical protein [Clostridia bacterium]